MTKAFHETHFVKITKKKKFDDFDSEEESKERNKQITYRNNSCQDEFRCKHCKAMIGRIGFGTSQRNHCPNCLHSLHVDKSPGDRASDCGSIMEPISIWVRKEEWVLLHRCKGCGVIHANRIGPDDNEILLLSLAAKALAKPCVPLYKEEEN
ncbi:RNHCP domain-containing protein [Leptospira kobayashii]|uniref:RNHCP domain-containing protein n=1 Tax=Leptospira kobayashii TaxID=1917830 RepID=A0ABM7UJH7_9LEPT|nr:RNHCP domain-containing protein [Leptospira kobayashii]BDA78988.1 RNHCP domain-containing protein [Leptospira kobayashii]